MLTTLGPFALQDGPFGYSAAAESYDKIAGHWASSLNGSLLTKQASQYVDEAKTCGFTGLVMLQGLLQALGGSAGWSADCLANFHPTYFGMMVAAFNTRSDATAAIVAHAEL